MRELKGLAFTKVAGNSICRVSKAKMGLGVQGQVESFRAPAKEHGLGTSLVVQGLRLSAPTAGGLGLIPDQGNRSHMWQLRVPVPQLKILHSTAEIRDTTCHS